MIRFAFRRVENIVKKGNYAVFLHVLIFLKCFEKGLFRGSLKPQNCFVKG